MKIPGVGSIQKLEDKPNNKCRKWRLRVYVGLNPRTGKGREKSKRFTGTIKEAKVELARFADEAANTQHSDGRKMSVDELCDEWIQERLALHLISESTASKNRYLLATLCRHIGKIDANKLKTYMVTDAVKALMAGDSPSGKNLSGTTMQAVLTATQSMYDWALKHGHVSDNPIRDVPRPKNDTERRRALTYEQLSELTSKLTPTDHRHAALMLALHAGLRLTETTLIQWQNVNFLSGYILVPGTKTNASYGTVPLYDSFTQWLLAWKESQRIALSNHGLVQCDSTPVLTDEYGQLMTPKAIQRWWARNRKRYGLDGFKFHELRHTFATHLARSGATPDHIKNAMRHSDPRMALEIYNHVAIEDTHKMMQRFDPHIPVA